MAVSRPSPYFYALAPLLAFVACQGPAPVDPGGEPGGESADETSEVTAAACFHSPCVTGAKLANDCEPCVTTVCNADSFCCNNEWDGVCVDGAKKLCGARCDASGGGGATLAENTNALCSDGVDNDGDKFIDCADFNCSKNAAVTVCGGAGGAGGAGSGGAGAGGAGAGGSGGAGSGGAGGAGSGGAGGAGAGSSGGAGGASGDAVRLRIMASNMTGNSQKYGPDSTRIFQAIDPDIVAIQEFNAGDNTPASLRTFVDQAFGTNYAFSRETGGNIPNGVVSRFPILQSGEWDDTTLTDRDFAYARIGLPNGRDLWTVSVHFRTTGASDRLKEAAQLVNYIKAQVPPSDLLVLGGDFNTGSRSESCVGELGKLFVTASPYPRDQAGNTNTNNSRGKPYDWLLADPDLDPFEVPVDLGGTSFAQGLVFDSRVFTPLTAVAPVIKSDSSTHQHMGVVREFVVPAAD